MVFKGLTPRGLLNFLRRQAGLDVLFRTLMVSSTFPRLFLTEWPMMSVEKTAAGRKNKDYHWNKYLSRFICKSVDS